MPEDDDGKHDFELDSYQLYSRYEDAPHKGDWRKTALRGPTLPTVGNAVAGAVGAAVSNLATYPLSLIITRLQTQKQRRQKPGGGKSAADEGDIEEEYKSLLDAARKICARGGISALYAGLAQDTAKTMLDSFLFFLAYELFRRRRIAARYGSKRRSKHVVLPILDELAVGVLAGAFAKLFTTPLANIVARKQASQASVRTQEIAAKIRAEKGIRGFWSGYSASLILTLNPSITFFLNEVLRYAIFRRNKRRKPSALATFLLAAISKSTASSITYPFSMAKTRSQVSDAGPGPGDQRGKSEYGDDSDEIFLMPSIISNVLNIARAEGVSALYAGLPGEVLKGFFSHGFTMLVKDAVYAGIVRGYYLLLIVARRYPSPEELLERAREQAEEYAEAARDGAKGLVEKARSGAEDVLDAHTGNVAVDMTSNTSPIDMDGLASNETAELVGDYVEDEAREWRSLYHCFSMSTEKRSGPGLGDLEKELTCSICTDLLYQPLTLLDCLHTFCGSCLKEWFYTQASRRSSSSSSSPRYTCPSCRANVRETRPNATVTTLLDMVLAASPDQAKPDAEKAEIEQRYKHGESVFPPVTSPGNSSTESDGEDDRRLLEEVRQLSLQESRARTRTARRTEQPLRIRRADNPDSDGTREDGRSRRRREEEREARRQRAARQTPVAPPQDSAERTRRVEHQSSLRSLLSLSDTESIEAEILRQIFEEGLLDDIDMENLGPGQEEELSERIAEAYRRKHLLRSRFQHQQENPEPSQPQIPTRMRLQSQQRPQITPTTQASPRNTSAPRPHQRRLSEQGGNRRRQTSPVLTNPASSSDITLGPAARSSSDIMSDRSRSSHTRSQTIDTSTRRTRRAASAGQSIPNITIEGVNNTSASNHTGTRSSIDLPRTATPSSIRPRNGISDLSTTSSLVAQEPRSRPSSSSSRSNALTQPVNFYPEPSISCDRCGKLNIQYDFHKKCSQCNDGKYHLCLRCYRLGRGSSAEADFERMRASSSGQPSQPRESQHILQSFKYSRPPASARRFVRDGKEGLFCDRCQSPANDCFWKYWGKCCTHPLLPIRRLAPGSRAPPDRNNNDNNSESFKILSFSTKCDTCACPIPASSLRFHCLRCNDGDYDNCSNCYLKHVATSKIRKEDGHNGWRRCLKGHRMVVIGFEDHPEGQRRVIVHNLVGGHALKDNHLPPAVTTAQPTSNPGGLSSPEAGVGDWSWKEGSERRKKASRIRSSWNSKREQERERGGSNLDPNTPPPLSPAQTSSSTSTTAGAGAATITTAAAAAAAFRFPPDGGIGLIVHAMWSYYPEDGVKDELMFPRGAEITEVENINDDWYWGCYAGMTGLFPGSHVEVVGEIV
ncbi:hypothetical protein P175DRAFT_0513517 [Aspergillus ochraceoroseus IBT 24754]|uniref:RING-type domain-containing protein n=1 Tax=Aspergillus ochraceoroseus IBT 24754 TaxID=1392256 RepID=A0A2T5M7R4_9EURO|nr:uncharacterized protein P175DRAFT_0513517 [Aspergillus ochraceoroseus IBT 24754]PTU24563.1 hypothetical protein P175DRAFT_0513517 [Aspergillus ochraceoroseus IBT 24754]